MSSLVVRAIASCPFLHTLVIPNVSQQLSRDAITAIIARRSSPSDNHEAAAAESSVVAAVGGGWQSLNIQLCTVLTALDLITLATHHGASLHTLDIATAAPHHSSTSGIVKRLVESLPHLRSITVNHDVHQPTHHEWIDDHNGGYDNPVELPRLQHLCSRETIDPPPLLVAPQLRSFTWTQRSRTRLSRDDLDDGDDRLVAMRDVLQHSSLLERLHISATAATANRMNFVDCWTAMPLLKVAHIHRYMVRLCPITWE